MTNIDKSPEERRTKLHDVEPLRPVQDDEPVARDVNDDDRIGIPAVETSDEPPREDDGLDELRRG